MQYNTPEKAADYGLYRFYEALESLDVWRGGQASEETKAALKAAAEKYAAEYMQRACVECGKPMELKPGEVDLPGPCVGCQREMEAQDNG